MKESLKAFFRGAVIVGMVFVIVFAYLDIREIQESAKSSIELAFDASAIQIQQVNGAATLDILASFASAVLILFGGAFALHVAKDED